MNDRFFGNLTLGLSSLLGLGLIGRGRREFSLLDGNGDRGRSSSAFASKHLLNLDSIVASVLLAHGGNLISLLVGNASDLGGLGVDGIGSGLDVLVNHFLV